MGNVTYMHICFGVAKEDLYSLTDERRMMQKHFQGPVKGRRGGTAWDIRWTKSHQHMLIHTHTIPRQ